MKEIKELFTKVENWILSLDKNSLNTIKSHRIYDDKSLHGKVQKIIDWYDGVIESKNVDLITGNKICTIQDISDYMYNYVSQTMKFDPKDYEDEEGELTPEEVYDEDAIYCGYATLGQIAEIKNFWKNLDQSGIESVAAGSYTDDYEIDLDGYRNYLLSHSGIYPMIFNYMYYTLGKSTEQFDDDIYNSCDSTDAISNFYPPNVKELPSNEEINKLANSLRTAKTKEQISRFDSMLKDIVKSFKDCPELEDKINKIKEII